MKKKILLLSMTLVLALSLFGCGTIKKVDDGIKKSNKETVVDKNDDKKEETTKNDEIEIPEGLELSKAEKCVYSFVQSIMTSDYETALTMLDVDTTFISADDLKWFIPRSSVAGIEDETNVLENVESSDNTTEKEVQLTFGKNTYTFNTILNDNNEWKISLSDFCIKDWNVGIISGGKLTLDDIPVTDTYFTKKDGRRDVYTIPAIAIRNTNAKVTSSIYGDFTTEILPTIEKDVEFQKIYCEITGEIKDALFNDLLTLLNKMNEGYENGETAADFAKYVASDANVTLAQILYDSVDQEHTWNDSLDPTNIRFTIVKPNPNCDEKTTFEAALSGDNEILLNTAFEKVWDEKYNGKGDCRSFGYIYVKRENGELKISDIPASNNLIEERNDMTNDW